VTGKPDLVVANYNPARERAPRNGDGTFQVAAVRRRRCLRGSVTSGTSTATEGSTWVANGSPEVLRKMQALPGPSLRRARPVSVQARLQPRREVTGYGQRPQRREHFCSRRMLALSPWVGEQPKKVEMTLPQRRRRDEALEWSVTCGVEGALG